MASTVGETLAAHLAQWPATAGGLVFHVTAENPSPKDIADEMMWQLKTAPH